MKKLLVDDEGLSLINLVKLLTISPRKIMGFNYDLLKIGVEAELVLFDANENWVFEKKNIFSQSINSPFFGQELSGKIKYTVSKGYISQIF